MVRKVQWQSTAQGKAIIREIIKKMPVEARRKLAKETTDRYNLYILSTDDDINVCVNVAENLATTEKILDDLARHLSYLVKRKVAAHPKTMEKTFMYLLKTSTQASVICALARNGNLPENGFDFLMRKRNSNILCALADNPKISSSRLEKLSEKKDTKVKCRVARHVNTSKQVRDKLANDPDEMVRFEVECYYKEHPEEK